MKALTIHRESSVLLVLACTAFAVTLIIPQFANGMYDPKHGRWLQRGDITESWESERGRS